MFADYKYIHSISILSITIIQFLLTKQKSKSPLTLTHSSLISKVYYGYIATILHQLTNNKEICGNSFSLFESQWLKYHQSINEGISNLLQSPYLLIPISLSKSIEGYPFIPFDSNCDAFKWDLSNFFWLSDLIVKIKGNNYLNLNRFPVPNSYYDYQIGDAINLYDKGVESFACKYCNKEYIVCLIENVILFGVSSSDVNRKNFSVIKMKFALRNMNVVIGERYLNGMNSKRRKFLILKVKDNIGKYTKMDILFDNEEDVIRKYEKIVEMKNIALIKESKYIHRYFERLINDHNSI